MIYPLAYLAVIVLANLATEHFGPVWVFPGLQAPAGVIFAGAAFSLRDLTQDRYGKRWSVAVIVAGAAISFLIGDGRIAVASGVAFLLSELVDFAVYTPLRRSNRRLAMLASNAVGAAIDSYIFLALAFGSLAFWPGQWVGKMWITLAFVVALDAIAPRHRRILER